MAKWTQRSKGLIERFLRAFHTKQMKEAVNSSSPEDVDETRQVVLNTPVLKIGYHFIKRLATVGTGSQMSSTSRCQESRVIRNSIAFESEEQYSFVALGSQRWGIWNLGRQFFHFTILYASAIEGAFSGLDCQNSFFAQRTAEGSCFFSKSNEPHRRVMCYVIFVCKMNCKVIWHVSLSHIYLHDS